MTTNSLHAVHPESEETFWYWIKERQNIYHRREVLKEPGPWTDDPILRKFAFCNVFREQDKVTVWVRENIREPFANHPNLWLMLAIARTINWPDTLRALFQTNAEGRGIWPLDETWRPQDMGDELDRLKASGAKIYTGAYMIRAESDQNKPWYSWTKRQYIARIVIGSLWENRRQFDSMFGWENTPDMGLIKYPDHQPSLKQVHDWIVQHHGWGPFMAYEVVTDLRHTRYLRNAPDINKWANAGPGAIRGLKRMFPLRDFKYPIDYLYAMRELLARSRENLPVGFPALELRDIEHSACEMDKYSRVKHGEGRPRAMFAAGKEWVK